MITIVFAPVDGLVSVSYSFVTGKDAAVNRGTDVVYYYDPKKPESITGLCRFGLKASSIILPSYNYAATAHGGVVEAVLDDITGTVVRHCVSIWMATSDFTAKLRKVSIFCCFSEGRFQTNVLFFSHARSWKP